MRNKAAQNADNDFSIRLREGDIVYRSKTPKLVNHYILGEVLGKGSYSTVREALDTNSMKRVAIKIVKRQVVRKIPGGEQAIKRESGLSRELDHPNCIQFLESFHDEEKEKIYMVFEYVDGITLQELIDRLNERRKLLPMFQAQMIFRDLVVGVQYLHSVGIVHRDLKPGNCLLSRAGSLKISDFGVAERLSSFDDPQYQPKAQGSPAIQPPEVASGTERFSAREGDVWAIGISLFCMVTGRYPFEGSTVYTLFENIARKRVPVPKSLPRPLRKLIEGMLDKSPSSRWTLDQVMESKWFNADIKRDSDPEPIPGLETLFTPEFMDELTRGHHESEPRKTIDCGCILL